MSELTDAAKAEIRDAVRIVREDRFEKFVRTRMETQSPPEPITTSPIPPKNDPVPPPVKVPDQPAPPPDDQKRHSAYWGELFE